MRRLRTANVVGLTLAATLISSVSSSAAHASGPAVVDGVGGGSPVSPQRSTDPAPSPESNTSTTGLITFDDGTSPCEFDDTRPLTDKYADLGVHFEGPQPDQGGAELNQCGRFGVKALSGRAFLAFNTATYALTPEHIRFDEPQHTVQLYVANGRDDAAGATYRLKGKSGGSVVARDVLRTASETWLPLTLTADAGIHRVVLTATTSDGTFVVDDLSFSTD